jgi:peptidyl-prolyl cis-trans isomerase D
MREKVSADYIENEKRRQFVELGKSLRTQIEARVKAGEVFDKAVAAVAGSNVKVETKSIPAFTLRQPPQDIDYSVLGPLERLEKGQVSEMVIGQDKGTFLYVIDKKLPDLAESSPAYIAARTQLASSISRFNSDSYLQDLVAQELKKSEPVAQ